MTDKPEFENVADKALIAGHKADELIAREVDRQDVMWGVTNERSDAENGELMQAAMAQLVATHLREQGFNGFAEVPVVYPKNWSGFRDYGSTVANLVVAGAFIRQEIKRRIMNGEDTTRTSRTEPYTKDQPKAVS